MKENYIFRFSFFYKLFNCFKFIIKFRQIKIIYLTHKHFIICLISCLCVYCYFIKIVIL